MRKCPHCLTGNMSIQADGCLWCDHCESTPPDEAKCPMCGVAFSRHDGLIPMCRRYHRLRAEIMALMAEWGREPSTQTLCKIGQLQFAIESAQRNHVSAPG